MKNIYLLVLCFCLTIACKPTENPKTLPNLREDISTPFLKSSSPALFEQSISNKQAETQKLLLEIKNLVEQRQSILVGKPGWWYRISIRHIDRDTLFFSPKTISYPIKREEWYEMDALGNIISGYSRTQDSTDAIIQVKSLSGEIWHNLTDHSESLFDQTRDFNPGAGFYSLASQLAQQGNHINKQTLYNNCWYIGEQYRIAEKDLLYEAVFNPDSGELRWLKTWKFSSENLTLLESIEFIRQEWVGQPPPEVVTEIFQVTRD